MAIEIPTVGAAVALRLHDGHEQVGRVLAARNAQVHLEPQVTASIGDEVQIAWVTHAGSGRRARARVTGHEGDETAIEVIAVTSLAGRFLRRFRPARPLIAEIRRLDSFGQVSEEVFGPVRDLALAGAGVETGALEEGEMVLLTLADESGHALVADIEARVARVGEGADGRVTGLVFSSPFQAAPAVAALEQGEPGQPV
jgi:hypothetical protein